MNMEALLMPQRKIGQARQLLMKAAAIAGAHSPQAANDIRAAFKVTPVFGPPRIYVAGEVDLSIVRRIYDRDEIPVVPFGLGIPGNHAEYTARYCVPLLLGCDGVAMAPGWEQDRRAVIEHDAAERHQIPVTYETV